MSTLVSYPGRYGDLIWALPCLRALSRRSGERIDLQICGEFASIIPLLQRQSYLGDIVADERWGMSDGWVAPTLGAYSRYLALGYRRWPELPLPLETLCTLNLETARVGATQALAEAELDLQTPWITNLPPAPPTELAIGFSECHFELKVGLVTLLEKMGVPMQVLTHETRTRWFLERPRGGYPLTHAAWLEEAAIIRNADVFLGCNSGLHVLAVAIGTPVVVVEPMEARHNPIFFPLGDRGPQVTLVKGNDGQPTFDARAVREAIEEVLGRSRR